MLTEDKFQVLEKINVGISEMIESGYSARIKETCLSGGPENKVPIGYINLHLFVEQTIVAFYRAELDNQVKRKKVMWSVLS
jgi:hypothetical protein